jgi:hypothetical protein
MMFRKAIISFVATVALGVGIAGMTSAAEAKHSHRHGYIFFPMFGFYDGHFNSRADHYAYDDYYYQDCGYRRVVVKKWNKSHTKRVKVYKKRWVCY